MQSSRQMEDRDISSEEDSDPEVEMETEEDEDSEEEENESGREKEEEEEEEEDDDDDDDDDGDDDDDNNEDNEHEDEGEEEDDDVNGNEAQKDAEMEELEKEYMNLRQEEQDILKNLKRHKEEDLLKGQAVKNQKALWDKALEFRFLLQKVFASSNKLPQEPVKSSFCDSDEAVQKAYGDLITSSKQTLNCLLELQEALVDKNPSIQLTDGNKKKSPESEELKNSDIETNEEWSRIQQLHSRIAPFRDSSIDKWQRKTQVTSGAAGLKGKLHAFNQNISQQVSAYMRDPSRMIKRMRLRRSTVGVFGAVPVMATNTEEKDADNDGDPELLDDSEFYQQLLKEFFESVDPASSETAFYALKRLQTKKRKIVDRRASKGRKLRYNVHEKMANFTAKEPRDLPLMAPKLCENLFGQRNRSRTAEAQ